VSLTVYDFTDRELILIIRDAADGDGVCTADDLAEALGYGEKAAHRVQPRLSWMTRYGMLERNGRGWKITRDGLDIAIGVLKASFETGLVRMTLGQRVLAMRALAQEGYVRGDDVQAAAVRREWQHQAAKRPR
jgi:hypothetical protein